MKTGESQSNHEIFVVVGGEPMQQLKILMYSYRNESNSFLMSSLNKKKILLLRCSELAYIVPHRQKIIMDTSHFEHFGHGTLASLMEWNFTTILAIPWMRLICVSK